ncbi:hypothetical protein, partial [Yersinia enterocolitica]
SMHSIQGNLRKNGEFINNQGGAVLHHNSPIPWSTFAQYLTTAMTTYRKDADVGEQFGVISQLRYNLPDIAQFDSQAGIKAVSDARRRHKS